MPVLHSIISLESHRRIGYSEFSTFIILHDEHKKREQGSEGKHFHTTRDENANSAKTQSVPPSNFAAAEAMFPLVPPFHLLGSKARDASVSDFLMLKVHTAAWSLQKGRECRLTTLPRSR